MGNQYVMLGIKKTVTKQDGTKLVYIRKYTNDLRMIETIRQWDKNNKLMHRWDSDMTSWIYRALIPSVKKDYIRWGWEVILYEP